MHAHIHPSIHPFMHNIHVYRKVPAERPYSCNPCKKCNPWIFTSKTWGQSACTKWGCYHSPLPCIPPPSFYLLSSTEEGGALWQYFTGTSIHLPIHPFIHLSIHPPTHAYILAEFSCACYILCLQVWVQLKKWLLRRREREIGNGQPRMESHLPEVSSSLSLSLSLLHTHVPSLLL